MKKTSPSENSLRGRRRAFLAGLAATGLLYATPLLVCVNEAEAGSRSSRGSRPSGYSRGSRPSRYHHRGRYSRGYGHYRSHPSRYHHGRYHDDWRRREAEERLREGVFDALDSLTRPPRY